MFIYFCYAISTMCLVMKSIVDFGERSTYSSFYSWARGSGLVMVQFLKIPKHKEGLTK